MSRFLDFQTRFRDRLDAGQQLARRLEAYRKARPVVFAIPRGGVPVGAEIARYLDAGLDVVVARKLGAPLHAELAIGAVTADGERFLNRDIISQLRVDDAYLEQITKEQREEARRREQRFRGGRPPADVKGRNRPAGGRRAGHGGPAGSPLCDWVALPTLEQVEDAEVVSLLEQPITAES